MITNICCIGAGYVGGPTMAMIAAKCPDIRVTVVDVNASRIAAWNSDELPIYEPGLDDVVRTARGRNLFFSTDVDEAHPPGGHHLRQREHADQELRHRRWKCRRSDERRTVRTAYRGRRQRRQDRRREVDAAGPDGGIAEARPPREFQRATNSRSCRIPSSSPKALRSRISRVPIASSSAANRRRPGWQALQTLVDVYARWVPRERILTTNVWSSELSKLVSNALLAQRISSVNSLSALVRSHRCRCRRSRVRGRQATAASERSSSRRRWDSAARVSRRTSSISSTCAEHYGLDEVARLLATGRRRSTTGRSGASSSG